MMIRYMFWMLIWNLTVFYKMYPWAFVILMLVWAIKLPEQFLIPNQEETIAVRVKMLENYWQSNDALRPPGPIMRKILALGQEARKVRM